MLVLRRREGQWVNIKHSSGEQLRIRIYNIRCGFPGQVDVAFDDACHNFEIQRPERIYRPVVLEQPQEQE
jgi:hypothetical protein